jgi:hypothetical protein
MVQPSIPFENRTENKMVEDHSKTGRYVRPILEWHLITGQFDFRTQIDIAKTGLFRYSNVHCSALFALFYEKASTPTYLQTFGIQTFDVQAWLPCSRDCLLVELQNSSLYQISDSVVGIFHLRNLVSQGLDCGLWKSSFAFGPKIVIDILDNLKPKNNDHGYSYK